MFLDKSYRLTVVLCRKNNDFAPAQLRQLEAQLGDLVHQQGDLALDQVNNFIQLRRYLQRAD